MQLFWLVTLTGIANLAILSPNSEWAFAEMCQLAPDSWPVKQAPVPLYTAMDAAWNIPIEISCTSDSWTRGSGENTKAMQVDLLEGESGTISSKILTVVMGSIMLSNPAAAGALKLMKS